LPQVWQTWFRILNSREWKSKVENAQKEDENIYLTFAELWPIFLILPIGYFLGMITLIFERLKFKGKIKDGHYLASVPKIEKESNHLKWKKFHPATRRNFKLKRLQRGKLMKRKMNLREALMIPNDQYLLLKRISDF
jgi:hypothetical protein